MSRSNDNQDQAVGGHVMMVSCTKLHKAAQASCTQSVNPFPSENIEAKTVQ
jgi:hypothetical protein